MHGHQVIHTIVCGAIVDLFHSWGIGVAPGRPTDGFPGALPDLASSIDFYGDRLAGSLHLCCPLQLFAATQPKDQRQSTPEDWIRELCNQLMGKIKRRFKQSSVDVGAGLPRVAHPNMLRHRIDRGLEMTFYEFRTRSGSALLILEGKMDATRLRYSGGGNPAADGVILFGDDGEK